MRSDRPTHGWCPACKEESAINPAGECLWCGGPTTQRPKRKTWKRPDLKGSRYTQAQLRAMHIFHMRDGISINQLATRTYKIAGYGTVNGAGVAISREWKRMGLKVRPRIEQTVLSSTKHGRKRRNQTNSEQTAYRRWLAEQRGWKSIRGPGQPLCEGVRENHPRKGDPCGRPAAEGSRFCPHHDPEKAHRNRVHLEAVHEQQRLRLAETALPMAPFAAFVKRRWEEEGSLTAAAARLDLHPTAVSTYARALGSDKKPKATIQRATVERVLESDGTTLEDLYPDAVGVLEAVG